MSLEHNDKIEWTEISKLKSNPKNTNQHPKEQIDRLVKILKYQGFRSPIVVSNRSGLIVAGHARVEAAKKMGLTKVPVSYQDFEDEQQEFAHLNADNEIARWASLDVDIVKGFEFDVGFDMDLLGIKDVDFLNKEEKKEGNTDEDAVPELSENEFGVKIGDVFQLGNHRVMCGDSTDKATVEKLLSGNKMDMVFTDPPYGIGESASKRSTRETNSIAKSNSHLKEFVDDSIEYAIKAFNIVQEIVKPKTQIWFGANYYCHSLPQSNNWLVWDKRIEDKQKDNNSDCELAWVENGRNSVRIFRHLWKGLIKGSENGQKRVHPTQKPIALAEWCFENYGDPKLVLDLFLGSGSTLIACEKTNRICFGMELDPHYVSVIIKRWQDYTGQRAVKL